MQFIKHIGKHSDRRVAIIYRVVPDELHMCLVAYPDSLPTAFHDAIMKVIESDAGQSAKELSDALFRNLLNDGRPILETLHKEGMIKKVPCNQIVVTPNAHSHVRLDELNKILDGIEAGDDAAKDMKRLDERAGMVAQPNKVPAGKINEGQPAARDNYDPGDFSDEGLARQRLAQSSKMAAEARSLLAESERLQTEAWNLHPELRPAESKEAPPAEKKPAKKKAVKKKATRKKAVKKAKVATTASTSAATE